MQEGLISLLKRREMISNLVSRDLKSRYKGSVLGFLWSVLTPLFMAIIYVFFLRILARGVPLSSIIIGVFVWQFTAQSVNGGMVAITANDNLVKKVFFPRTVLPLASTLGNLVNFLLSMIVGLIVVAVLLMRQDQFFNPMIILVPLLILYHFLFNFSISLLLSSSNVYFRDTQHLVGVLLTAWFFISPAMYDLDLVRGLEGVSQQVMDLYMLNPMAGMITAYRALILPDAMFPYNAYTLIGLLVPIPLFFISLLLFKRAQKNFADYL